MVPSIWQVPNKLVTFSMFNEANKNSSYHVPVYIAPIKYLALPFFPVYVTYTISIPL